MLEKKISSTKNNHVFAWLAIHTNHCIYNQVYNRYMHKNNRNLPKDDAKDRDKILREESKGRKEKRARWK